MDWPIISRFVLCIKSINTEHSSGYGLYSLVLLLWFNFLLKRDQKWDWTWLWQTVCWHSNKAFTICFPFWIFRLMTCCPSMLSSKVMINCIIKHHQVHNIFNKSSHTYIVCFLLTVNLVSSSTKKIQLENKIESALDGQLMYM